MSTDIKFACGCSVTVSEYSAVKETLLWALGSNGEPATRKFDE
jgi:hypothetical protein